MQENQMYMDLQAPVSTIMTTSLHTAQPEDSVAVLDKLFKEHRIHHVPIVDENGMVAGIISKSDFLYLLRGFTVQDIDRFREEAKLRAFKIREIMRAEVTTLPADAPIKEAVALLAENRFRSLPVVDAAGALVGIVTTHDIVDLVNSIA
jgi:CBS domain-containing protein